MDEGTTGRKGSEDTPNVHGRSANLPLSVVGKLPLARLHLSKFTLSPEQIDQLATIVHQQGVDSYMSDLVCSFPLSSATPVTPAAVAIAAAVEEGRPNQILPVRSEQNRKQKTENRKQKIENKSKNKNSQNNEPPS